MSNVNISAQHIAELNPMSIVKDPLVRQRFIDLYAALWSDADAEAVYEREAIHFNRVLADNAALKECTPTSIFIAFIDLAVSGLSVAPGAQALAYLTPRGYKTGRRDDKGRDIYEKRCALKISGYGELIQRTRSGQIRHVDNPVIVYEGDGFTVRDHNGVKEVDYTLNLGHNARRPVACYMRITRADGSVDYAVMLEEDWRRLEGFSGEANKYWDKDKKEYVRRANDLYSSGEGDSIDTGFLKAKCIKHAFRNYPRMRVGRGTVYESDEPQRAAADDFYGMDSAGSDSENPAADAARPTEETFAPEPDTSTGVTVDPAAIDDDEVF